MSSPESVVLEAVRTTWNLDDDEVASLLDAYFKTPYSEGEEFNLIAEGFEEWLREELWDKVCPGEKRITRVLIEKRGWHRVVNE